MKIALCYESVLPNRGGCETYIADLSRRLVADGHEVRLYACRWDASALPSAIRYSRLPSPPGPRFLRPWRFSATCVQALQQADHDVSVGFNKTWGQDVLYPQGGLHSASAEHNLQKYSSSWVRKAAKFIQQLDPAHRSFTRLEHKQYLSSPRPVVIVNSHMVRRHCGTYLDYKPEDVHVVRSAIDPKRFEESDRPRRRLEARRQWGLHANETVGLFAATNYRLKGLAPLLRAVRLLPSDPPFRLLVVGSPKTHSYEQLAHRLGISDRVCFAGYCGEMRNAYFAADFLTHPTFYDPCSLVALEALACGLPVVTTRYNGASELLTTAYDGYVIDDPHQSERLAEAMQPLLDPTHRAACSRAARRTAATWTFEDHYRELLQVFLSAAQKRSAA